MVQGSPEWHEWRKGGVGASEVAAILGICPYNTAHGVWLVKTGRAKGFEGNSFTQHGKEQETKARSRYELIHMDDMVQDVCAIHPKYQICRASLDGLSRDGRTVLEIKCPKGEDLLRAAKSGNILPHYWPQVQFQLAVTGADLLHFYVYHVDSKEDALVEVKPDLTYQGYLFSEVLQFWKYVERDIAPPLTDRDIKVCDDMPEVLALCKELLADSLPKNKANEIKAKVVQIAGHPKVRCGQVQISTVLRNGEFSFHKLTIKKEGA